MYKIETNKEYKGFSTFYNGTDIFIVSDKKIKTKADCQKAVLEYAAKTGSVVIYPEWIYDAMQPAVMVKKINKHGEYISIHGSSFGITGNENIIIVF